MDKQKAMNLEEREKGQLPVSIATSLAIESILGIMESDDPNYKKPSTPPILQYDSLWINLRTLFRNMFGSINRVEADKITYQHWSEALHLECLTIQAAIQQASHGNCTVVFYAATHRTLGSFYPKALLRAEKTPIQLAYAATEKRAIEGLSKIHSVTKDFLFSEVDVKLYNQQPTRKTLILSHTCIDLIENVGFTDISLLESHTGAIKPRTQWYTKLKGGPEMERIPFDKATLQLFGDKGNMFSPYPKSYRDAVITCSEKNKWTQATTKSRILLTLELERNPVVLAAFKELY